jgi:hypothetical protein
MTPRYVQNIKINLNLNTKPEVKMKKLNQIVAVEKSIKSQTQSTITKIHRQNQKQDLFNGFNKSYRAKNEEDETLPGENKKVQVTVDENIEMFEKALTELLNITASKDYGNMSARADVVVDGEILIKEAPVPYLLFLEKQLNDIKTFISELPVLDSSEEWEQDVNSGLYKTIPTETHRTKKVQKPIVLFPATDRHAAQTQLITEDIVVGYWKIIKTSGALPIPLKKKYLERVEKLSIAVKYAREEANSSDAVEKEVGKKIFGYLFR